MKSMSWSANFRSRPVPFGEFRSGVPVSFFAAAGLAHQLREARERLLSAETPGAARRRQTAHPSRASLTNWVMCRSRARRRAGAKLRFEIVSQRHQRDDRAVQSSIRRMDLRQATSARRPTHPGHNLALDGESLKQSKAGGGVKPNPPL
jgi:hypothetical protein